MQFLYSQWVHSRAACLKLKQLRAAQQQYYQNYTDAQP